MIWTFLFAGIEFGFDYSKFFCVDGLVLDLGDMILIEVDVSHYLGY